MFVAETVMNAFIEGGIFMYVILALGVLATGVLLERWKSLYITTKNWPEATEFRRKILEIVNQGDYAKATLAARQSATAIGRVIGAGLQVRANGGGEEELQARMDEQLSREVHVLDRRTGFLAMYGNVATLVGLLGTITGMIHSFAGVAQANPGERATMLSLGISQAMNCTAFGLIVAVPALVFYGIFQNKADHLINSLTNQATSLYNDLIFQFDAGTTPTQRRVAVPAKSPADLGL